VHTVAPIAIGFTEHRNLQVEGLADYFASYLDGSQEVIVLGDFNLSPWSTVYTDFLRKSQLVSASAGELHFTWHTVNDLLGVHIDHIFLSPNLSHSDFIVGEKAGSDHNLIYTEVYAN